MLRDLICFATYRTVSSGGQSRKCTIVINGRSPLRSCWMCLWSIRSSSVGVAGPPAARREPLVCVASAATSSAWETSAWLSPQRLPPAPDHPLRDLMYQPVGRRRSLSPFSVPHPSLPRTCLRLQPAQVEGWRPSGGDAGQLQSCQARGLHVQTELHSGQTNKKFCMLFCFSTSFTLVCSV